MVNITAINSTDVKTMRNSSSKHFFVVLFDASI